MKGILLASPLYGTLAHGLFGGTRTTTYTWTNSGQTVTAIQGGEYGNSILLGQGSSSIYASYDQVTTYFSKTLTIGTNGSVGIVSTSIPGYGTSASSSAPVSASVPLGTGSISPFVVVSTSSSPPYVEPTSHSSSIVAYIPTASSSVALGTANASSSSIVPPVGPLSSSVSLGTDHPSSSHSTSSLSIPLDTGSPNVASSSSTKQWSSETPLIATGNNSIPYSSSGSAPSHSSSVPLGTGVSASSKSLSVGSGSSSSSYSLSPSSMPASNSSVIGSTSSHTLSASISGSFSISGSASTSGSPLGSSSNSASSSPDRSSNAASNSPSSSGSSIPSGSPSSSAVAGAYPIVTTQATTINGQSTDVPIISGGSVTDPIVITPTTTYAGTEVTSSKDQVKSQLSSVFPLIQGWLDDTDSDPEPVIQNLDDIEDDVTNLINGLERGDDNDDSGCTSSLFSIFTCIIGDVTAIKGAITGTITGSIIGSIQGALTDLTSLTNQIKNVKENDDSNDDDDDDDDDDDQSSSRSSASSTASSSSASCSASAVAHTQVTCSPSPVSESGTIASYTQVCETGIETITKCSASYSASTTTLSTSSASLAAATNYPDFEGEQGGDISEEVYSEIAMGMGCMTGFQLPMPTACPLAGDGFGSGNSTSGRASASSSGSSSGSASSSKLGSSSITGSSSAPMTSSSVPASAKSSSSLSIPSSTSASSSSLKTSASASAPPSSTSAPPITSCALATQPLTTINDQEFPETIYCECNDVWQAGIGTEVDDEGYTTYTCQAATSTTIAVSTQPPPITSCELATQPLTTIYSQEYPETIFCDCNGGWMAGVGTSIGDDGATTYTCQAATSTTIAVSTKAAPPPPYSTGTCNMHIFEASLGSDLELLVQLNLTDGGGNLLSSTNYEAEWGDTMTLSGDDTKLPWDVTVEFAEQTTLSRKLRKRGVSKRELFDALRRDPEYADQMARDPELTEILRRDPMACIAKRNPIPQCGGVVTAPPDPYQRYEVKLSAGDSSWSTEDTDDEHTPYCSVGGWDNGGFGDFLDEVFSLGTIEKVPTRQMDCHFPC